MSYKPIGEQNNKNVKDGRSLEARLVRQILEHFEKPIIVFPASIALGCEALILESFSGSIPFAPNILIMEVGIVGLRFEFEFSDGELAHGCFQTVTRGDVLAQQSCRFRLDEEEFALGIEDITDCSQADIRLGAHAGKG